LLSLHPEASTGLYGRKVNVDRSTKRLATAILAQALRDALSTSGLGTQQVVGGWRRDALKWFVSDEEDPGSLRWVCRIVEMNVDDIRQWVVDHTSDTDKERKKWRRRLGRWRSRV